MTKNNRDTRTYFVRRGDGWMGFSLSLSIWPSDIVLRFVHPLFIFNEISRSSSPLGRAVCERYAYCSESKHRVSISLLFFLFFCLLPLPHRQCIFPNETKANWKCFRCSKIKMRERQSPRAFDVRASPMGKIYGFCDINESFYSDVYGQTVWETIVGGQSKTNKKKKTTTQIYKFSLYSQRKLLKRRDYMVIIVNHDYFCGDGFNNGCRWTCAPHFRVSMLFFSKIPFY